MIGDGVNGLFLETCSDIIIGNGFEICEECGKVKQLGSPHGWRAPGSLMIGRVAGTAGLQHIGETLDVITDEDERTRVFKCMPASVADYKRKIVEWRDAPREPVGSIDPHAVIAAAKRVGGSFEP